MPKVTVFKVKSYDMRTDSFIVSRRMATVDGAKIMGGEVMGSSGIEIDESELEDGFEWTPIGFKPQRTGDGRHPR